MPSINALSLTSDVIKWLENSHSPRILHVFDQACNLINERREVLSIVTPQIGNGPFNLVVEAHPLFSEHIDVESPVSVVSNQLTVGGLTIDTTNAKLCDPRPDWELLHIQREHLLNQLTHLPNTNYQPSLSASLLSTFSASVASGNLPASTAAARGLAGLGAGLTPAGDDFIMGALYAVWIIHPPDVASVLAQQIADTAVPLTTSLSAAWLRSAGKGEAGILWHEFFDALNFVDRIGPFRTAAAWRGVRDNPTYAIDKILAVGETSGADALAGFTGVLRCWAENRSNLWEYNQT